MKKESAEALQWFVDFANLNLQNIKPGDKAKLLVEAEEYLWPTKEEVNFSCFAKILSPKQLSCIAWVEKIPPKESQEYWDSILHLQKVIIEKLFLKFLTAPAPMGGMIIGQDQVLWQLYWKSDAPFKFRFFPITKSQDEYVTFKICSLLGVSPGHNITKCPGCEKFFFNPTRRKKSFCSPRCMWRVNTAKRREADPEGYREYQRKLMQDRYREKSGLSRRKTKARKKGKK